MSASLSPVKTKPDTRLLAVAEVLSALPDWSEEKINSWMDKGWTAKQIIENHGEPVRPPAPTGFGDEFESPVTEPVVEPEPVQEPETIETVETIEVEPVEELEEEPVVSAASLKRLKKAELVELATIQGLDSSGTKADIIARLIG